MPQNISSEDKIAFERYQVYKKRLEAILKQKNPKKIGAIDALLSKYRGREHGVYAKVCAKYGITPKPEWTPTINQQNDNNKSKTNNIKDKLKKMKKQIAVNKPVQKIRSKPKPPSTNNKISKQLPSKPNIQQNNSRQNKIKNKLSALKNKKIAQNKTNKIRQSPTKNIIKNKIPKKPSPPPIKKKIVIQKKEEESEDEYEDDFEDYSDDFEEEPAIKSPPKASQKKTVIKPINKKVEPKVHPLITKYNIKGSETKILFNFRERTVRELYLKRVGKEIYSRGIQSFYLHDIETQTEKYKKESKSTQYQFCDPTNKDFNYDRERLASFLRKSSKLMEGLLLHKNSDDTVKKLLSPNNVDNHQFLSDGITFVFNELLKNRSVNDIAFSLNNCNIIAVAYSKLNKDSEKDDEKDNNKDSEKLSKNVKYNGLVCIWDIRRPSFPIYQLISDDQVKTIQFLPNNDSLVIGGRQNGCIAAWDLTESNQMHRKYPIHDKPLYFRYPTYMTDCQWDNNHLYPIISLQFLNNDEFCSVDTSGTMNGWSISQLPPPTNINELISESNEIDIGCRDMETIKITQEFKFSIDPNKKHSIKSNACISVHPSDETRILFAYQTSIYMVEIIGSSVEIVEEYTLKYNVSGITYPNNNVVSVAFCPWIKNTFVAGYENGMICLFDIEESIPIRKFYDMNLMQSVLSVSWMKTCNDANGEDILLYGLFEDGRIRFLDLKVNQETQSYIFEKILSSNKSIKSHNRPCCKSTNEFIAISNMMGNHTFSIHLISA